MANLWNSLKEKFLEKRVVKGTKLEGAPTDPWLTKFLKLPVSKIKEVAPVN